MPRMAMTRSITVALAGNPNSGKSTIFNNLTGHRQHVGNYPGVTVETKQGVCRWGDQQIHIIDLPGTYSLTAYSPEELEARTFIVKQQPDVVVDVVDASNIERNLYLTTQLLDLGRPVIIALNMTDVAHVRGIEFDLKQLSLLLGTPIVPMVGSRNEGTRELIAAIAQVATDGSPYRSRHVYYGREIEEEVARVEDALTSDGGAQASVPQRWVALQLLEGDPEVAETAPSAAKAVAASSIQHLERVFGGALDTVMADRRYGFVSGACQEAVRSTAETRHSLSDAIDAVVTSSLFGLPLFLALMYVVFLVIFRLGGPATDLLSAGFGHLGSLIIDWWPPGMDTTVRDLLVEGVIGGVGGVLALLPNVLFLFMAIAILEDTGYMARAAFITDRLMHHIGLHGKSFIPLVLGFGCTVPAVMATRILENRRDRLTTMLVAPLMSCGAKFAVYSMLIAAFFPQAWRAPVLWSVYLIGVMLAMAGARLLRSTLLRGESVPLVMELPPYRMPTVRGILIHMWERGGEFVKKAGTVILALSIVLWAMTAYPRLPDDGRYDARRDEAAARYEEGLHSLRALLGLPESSAVPGNLLLDDRVGLEENAAEGSVDDHKREATGEGATMERFLSLLRDVRAIRERMADAERVRFEDSGSSAKQLLQEAAVARLSQLEYREPSLFSAAVRYLDEVEGPYRVALESIDGEEHAARLGNSAAGRIGHFMEPALVPLGFDWRIGTALIGAMAAREAFIAQLGILFAADGRQSSRELQHRLGATYPPLTGFTIMLFILIGSPCLPTLAVTYRESRSWKWPLLQIIAFTFAAYAIVFVVYSLGMILGVGTTIIG
ncbi:ferrous iron transport protein B [Candidatus Fermentibacteria bacterium]|nr:ferrous iron transport protein B [Candidatus Fermentibacteria bacterium]